MVHIILEGEHKRTFFLFKFGFVPSSDSEDFQIHEIPIFNQLEALNKGQGHKTL